MKKIAMIISLVCASLVGDAQTNYVKNPSFEKSMKCPDEINQLINALYWSCAVDTVGEPYYTPEYHNECATLVNVGVPENFGGYQYAHSGKAYIGAGLFYDKTLPPPAGATTNWRDYAQGHLLKPLQNGKTYCVSFWVVMAEISGYAHDNIGAYLDNGDINKRSPAGIEITDVVPQVFCTSIIKDTMNWVKIEGSFVANGNETHITLGNFAKQAVVNTNVVPYYAFAEQYSYYLIDDVSVIPIDLAADAGKDSHAELGKKTLIGRVGDTTATALDCKWYKKGILIDSGAIISVNAGAGVGKIDTYVVVQTVCGLVKTDTVTVKTVPVGFREYGTELEFSVYPNPSNGALTITTPHAVILTKEGSLHAKVYDLLGRVIFNEPLNFTNNEASININTASGIYILELSDSEENSSRQRIEIRN